MRAVVGAIVPVGEHWTVPGLPDMLRTSPIARRQRAAQHRRRQITEAAELRAMGWRLSEIAEVVGLSPMTVSAHIPQSLVHLDHRLLADRREATGRGIDHVVVTAARLLRRREAAERKRRERVVRGRTISVYATVRLDAPILGGEGHFGSVGEIVPRPRDLSDPQTYVEAELLDDIVGDLSIEDIGRLSDHDLGRLRARLLEAGFHPRGIQDRERERLREPERHRGAGAGPLPRQRVGLGSKRKQREKYAREKHSRPEQKPRRRWERA